jgi:imidazolonepropionase-like amidohydrolase
MGPSPYTGLVITDVTIVSPERATPLEHAYVRISEGKIVELSRTRLRGETEIDGAGRYLIPGLIDSHVHLAVSPGFPSSMTPAQAAARPDVVAASLAQDPRSYLFFGFTTVADLVGTAERTARWNALELRPDAYFCGAAVIAKDQVRRMPAPFFSYVPTAGSQVAATGDSIKGAAEAVIAEIAAEGAVCVKTVYDEFGGMTPTVSAGKELVAAAHAKGLPVFIHANRKRAQAFAVEAGIDVIVHGMWRNPNDGTILDNEAREILGAVVRNGTGYQPTTQVIVGELDMLDHNFLARPALSDAYTKSFLDYCASEKDGCRIGRFRNARSEVRIRETIDWASQVTNVLAKSNARLLFGSDTPSDMLYANPPGLNGRLEMNNWISAGVSKEKLFRALTIDNARALQLESKIGTVEPGKTANLLLLHANPLDRVEAYDAIETVFLHGRPIARSTLSARAAPAVAK